MPWLLLLRERAFRACSSLLWDQGERMTKKEKEVAGDDGGAVKKLEM
jgi:hypothetical protein